MKDAEAESVAPNTSADEDADPAMKDAETENVTPLAVASCDGARSADPGCLTLSISVPDQWRAVDEGVVGGEAHVPFVRQITLDARASVGRQILVKDQYLPHRCCV